MERDKKSCMKYLRCPYRNRNTGRIGRRIQGQRRRAVKNSKQVDPCNLGIRGVSEIEPQRIGSGDCLGKTQVSAKSKDDV